jgi:hypothetical protein
MTPTRPGQDERGAQQTVVIPGPAPRLTVIRGPFAGAHFEIPAGRSEIGREAGLALQLDADDVSRRHASLEHDGARVVVADLGSTNGTWVGGRRLSRPTELRQGDEVGIGGVVMRFTAIAEAAGGATHLFGDVAGPVQIGAGHQNVAGRDQHVAGRDLVHDHSIRLDADYDPWDEVFRGTGIGRFLMALGGVVSLIGFALWIYVIFEGATAESPTANAFTDISLGAVPVAALGFGLFLGGGVLAAIGGGMSKAARKRGARSRRAGTR